MTGSGEVAFGGNAGGGAYAEKFITDIASLLASETVTRGAAGTGAAASNSAGGTGGQSSAFGVTADGGAAGSGGAAQTPGAVIPGGAGGGGTAAGADLEIRGQGGSSHFAQAINRLYIGPAGGNTLYQSTRTVVAGASTPGDAALSQSFGVGGQVGAAIQNSTAQSGGAGANGIVIVDCFV